MKIGVIAIQGNVSEHVDALERTLVERNDRGEILLVRQSGLVPDCDALVIPGGESTTLARLMWKEGIAEEIQNAAAWNVPILGTCAGLVLLARHGDCQTTRTKQRLLGIMDIEVRRNAYGRQHESFETLIDIPIIGGEFPAIFIRAPAIVRCGVDVAPLAWFGEFIVAAQQGNALALAFHPEMVADTRLHHYFVDMI